MLKFIEIIKNIWAIDELKNRILITLFFLAIYRLGAQVVLPGVDYNIIANAKIAGDGGLLGLLNALFLTKKKELRQLPSILLLLIQYYSSQTPSLLMMFVWITIFQISF